MSNDLKMTALVFVLLMAFLLSACGGGSGGAAAALKPDPGTDPDPEAAIESVSVSGICKKVLGENWVKEQVGIDWITVYYTQQECQDNQFGHHLKAIGECTVHSHYLYGGFEFCYSAESTQGNLIVDIETIWLPEEI